MEKDIITFLKKNKSATGAELCRHLRISRQVLHNHIKKLIQTHEVVKSGSTRGVVYWYKDHQPQAAIRKIVKKYPLLGLLEDQVWEQVALELNLKKSLRPNIFQIVQYAFTEVLNNAIDHSQSSDCQIEFILDIYEIIFKVRDVGIGLFYSIYSKYNLNDEYEAIGELVKGKATTMAEKHSGEGIFFTSKTADYLSLRSHEIKLLFDNIKEDIFVEQEHSIQGTEVVFKIRKNSKKMISDIFQKFAPAEFDFQFQKTEVYVKLFQKEYMSRSEAKRLVSRLDQFKSVILDFKDVISIGQGFADEVFRVFQKSHPNIHLKIQNAGPVIQAMVQHVSEAS